ncbi:MAG: HupE/UreJ family protein [Rhodospirillaceae bacterium]|nr:MAG: HupE/UreJ family protein [Rhodospirillaceae bacterium]
MKHVSARVPVSVCTLTLAAVCLFPTLAEAHPGHGALHSLSDGFNHPLHGWDHLTVMIAVGAWAALQQSRVAWALPLTFLSVMAAGGVVGAFGLVVPGAEPMVGMSVAVFGFLVLLRRRVTLATGMGTVGLFAFFHGYAHGLEMPAATGLATYGLGFLLATAVLHGLGFLITRFLMVLTLPLPDMSRSKG